jgi:hypothetical protein
MNNPTDTDKYGTIDALDSDSDNDGISDKDEVKYGLNPKDNSDASKDNDGDGVSNIDEIKAGTDPNSSDSYPKTTTKQKLTLKAGWNLIGANMTPTIQELKNLIGADNLLIIQGEDKTYKKEYIDNGTEFLNDFTKMQLGSGYWVKLKNDVEFMFTPSSKNIQIELNSGWNLVNPTKELTIDEIKEQIGENNLLIIQGEDKTYKKEYIDNGMEFLNDFEKFEEPKGYWIKVLNDSILTE